VVARLAQGFQEQELVNPRENAELYPVLARCALAMRLLWFLTSYGLEDFARAKPGVSDNGQFHYKFNLCASRFRKVT
jgi:hypothetical protein